MHILYGGESPKDTTVKPVNHEIKDQLFSKWRNANTLSLQFNNMLRRVTREAVYSENENILFVNALDVFCEKKLTNLSGLLNFSNVKECDK